MPNGYTADIYEGKDVSLADYLMKVGRSMGFAIMQRDDPLDVPVKPVEETNSYRDKAIESAQATLAELKITSVEEASHRAKTEYEEALFKYQSDREDRLAMRGRYQAMITQVEQWSPDPLVLPVKEQALKYLHESMEHDCGKPGEEMRYYSTPKLLSGEEWIANERYHAKRDIKYHTDERDRELASVSERNLWIKTFLNSLPKDGN